MSLEEMCIQQESKERIRISKMRMRIRISKMRMRVVELLLWHNVKVNIKSYFAKGKCCENVTNTRYSLKCLANILPRIEFRELSADLEQ